MGRYNDTLVLSTSDVGRLLSVHPSTVKRWCNDGALATDKTDGGHRRIHLQDVLELARRRGIPTFLDPFEPYQAHVWTAFREVLDEGSYERLRALAMGWLTRGRHERMGRLFETAAHHPEISFPELLDLGVGGFMADVGECWREGRIRVGEEHLATQTLIETLLRVRSARRAGAATRAGGATPAGPAGGGATDGTGEGERRARAVVGSTDGDQHHLGALGVRLVLEAAGWDTLFLGPSVPIEDFHDVQRAHDAEMICISFSRTGSDPHRTLRVLDELYDRSRPYALALGGSGMHDFEVPVEGPFIDFRTFSGARDFADALGDGFGRPRETTIRYAEAG